MVICGAAPLTLENTWSWEVGVVVPMPMDPQVSTTLEVWLTHEHCAEAVAAVNNPMNKAVAKDFTILSFGFLMAETRCTIEVIRSPVKRHFLTLRIIRSSRSREWPIPG